MTESGLPRFPSSPEIKKNVKWKFTNLIKILKLGRFLQKYTKSTNHYINLCNSFNMCYFRLYLSHGIQPSKLAARRKRHVDIIILVLVLVWFVEQLSLTMVLTPKGTFCFLLDYYFATSSNQQNIYLLQLVFDDYIK